MIHICLGCLFGPNGLLKINHESLPVDCFLQRPLTLNMKTASPGNQPGTTFNPNNSPLFRNQSFAIESLQITNQNTQSHSPTSSEENEVENEEFEENSNKIKNETWYSKLDTNPTDHPINSDIQRIQTRKRKSSESPSLLFKVLESMLCLKSYNLHCFFYI